MPNLLGLAGGQPQKQTRFAPIYTGRWSSGLWTNRSPMRDAATTRIVEKFYGGAGDALIAGSNVEITNRLTLARRPGNSVYDSNSYTSVDRFENFRVSSPSTEQINVMIDQSTALYSLYNGIKSLLWTKQSNAGQSYMQSVGNTLYWADGASNKKWLQTLTKWVANAQWNIASAPLFSTFFIDPNGNIQQLTGTVLTLIQVQIASNVLTCTTSQTLTSILYPGCIINFPASLAATFLENQTLTVVSVSGNTFTATFNNANYGPTAESSVLITELSGNSTPIAGSAQPVWSTQVPSSSNLFAGGITNDFTVQWVNRGNPVENWGIANTKTPIVPQIGSSRTAWAKNTYYSPAGAVLDTNGNLQQVKTAGTSGSSIPTWTTTLNATTNDGTVVWTLLQTAASLQWAPGQTYSAGSYMIGNAGGTNCLFQLAPFKLPYIQGAVSAYLYSAPTSGAVGMFLQYYPTSTGAALASTTSQNSLEFLGNPDGQPGPIPINWNNINGAATVIGKNVPFPAYNSNYQLIILGSLYFPVAGQYSFTIKHHDGMIWGMGNGATLVSGTNNNYLVPPQTQTAAQGYPMFGGTNKGLGDGAVWTDTFTVNIPTPGVYPCEFDYAYWYHNTQTFDVQCNGYEIGNGVPQSGSTQPIWPSWSKSFAPSYPSVAEASGQLVWQNIGPVTDFTWYAKTGFTIPGKTIIDPAGYQEAPYETGVTGTKEPTFSTGLGQLTVDNPNLVWINQGPASAPPVGSVSTYNGGWTYCVALVNTLDNTVSNCSNLSAPTGNFIGAAGIVIPAGAGLPPLQNIDPQSDFVAVFRSTDGQVTPFLIPGTYTTYTLPLSQYLASGYTDTTPDVGLNNLISGAINGENTPPMIGAQNLAFHLGRLFYSIGNTVYWTSGANTPVGNGINGTSPLNYDGLPSLVKRIVPTTIGALIFTVSDVSVIQGSAIAGVPILPALPLMQGVGLSSYNALDINGSIIGFFTSDSQFCTLDPSSGCSYVGFPIGDQFRLNNGTPGQSWNPSSVYVTWHVQGEDQGWYVADGVNGWYRMLPTPAPETGNSWCPFATITGGARAVQSIEISPGVHRLLVGPTATGPILKRDLSAWQDNGSNYPAWAVIGSAVLAQPGQVATVSFVTTESVKVGTPLSIGLLMDEALPYYTGPFELLNVWTNDPPELNPSTSFYAQRFYLDETGNEAMCRHMQVKVQWNLENQPNELNALTVFGAFYQEK